MFLSLSFRLNLYLEGMGSIFSGKVLHPVSELLKGEEVFLRFVAVRMSFTPGDVPFYLSKEVYPVIFGINRPSC